MRSIVRSLFVCLALAVGAVAVKADTVVAFVPGHYLPPFVAVAYTHTQPVSVTIQDGLLVWSFGVFDLNGVYQGQSPLQWGIDTDVPLSANDYDGDGLDDPAVYRASNKTVYVLRSGCPVPAWQTGFWSCTYVLTLP